MRQKDFNKWLADSATAQIHDWLKEYHPMTP